MTNQVLLFESFKAKLIDGKNGEKGIQNREIHGFVLFLDTGSLSCQAVVGIRRPVVQSHRDPSPLVTACRIGTRVGATHSSLIACNTSLGRPKRRRKDKSELKGGSHRTNLLIPIRPPTRPPKGKEPKKKPLSPAQPAVPKPTRNTHKNRWAPFVPVSKITCSTVFDPLASLGVSRRLPSRFGTAGSRSLNDSTWNEGDRTTGRTTSRKKALGKRGERYGGDRIRLGVLGEF